MLVNFSMKFAKFLQTICGGCLCNSLVRSTDYIVYLFGSIRQDLFWKIAVLEILNNYRKLLKIWLKRLKISMSEFIFSKNKQLQNKQLQR